MAAAILLPIGSYAFSKGEKSVGLRGGYSTTHNSPVAGLFFQYRFTEHFRLSPEIDYYFRHDHTDAYALNVNADIPISLGADSPVNIYPLAGLNFTSWNVHHPGSTDQSDDTSTRTSRMGVNAGAGIEYYATPTLKFALEAKYAYVKHFDGAVITLSIGYVF
ncbi:MAG: porin family protein [Muribaculaceae bacterium]|nr:porin family protein [Muribaculaceae bacterium]